MNEYNTGFMKVILVLTITLLSLVMGGFNLGERVGSKQVSNIVEKSREPVVKLWNQYPGPYWEKYAQPYLSIAWNDILIGAVQENIENSIENIVQERTTQVEALVTEKEFMPAPETTNKGTTTIKQDNIGTSTKTFNFPTSNPLRY